MMIQNGTLILACGSIGIDAIPGLRALAYIIIGIWLVTLVLFPINVTLTFSENSSSFKIVNAQIIGVYTVLGVILFTCYNAMASDEAGFTIGCALVFLIPLMVLVHFVCLVVSVRRRKRRLENAPAEEVKEKQGQD